MISVQLRELLERQDGLVTRAQAYRYGLSPDAVRRLLAGTWRLVLPSVICVSNGDLNPRQRLLAAQLYAGRHGMIGSVTAAAWHGVTSAVDLRVHVLVPAAVRRRSAGFVVVHRTHRPDLRPWLRADFTVCSRPRAVVDAARLSATRRGAEAILCEAVERRLVTTGALRHELEAGPSAGSAVVRRALRTAEAGAWSVPEADLLRLVERSTVLSAVWPNPRLVAADGTRLPTPDGWFDDVALAVQVHSWQWHAADRAWTATVMSDGIFAEYGIVVVGVTPRAISQEPQLVLHRLERAHRAAAARPRPTVSALPSGLGITGSGRSARERGRSRGFP